MVHSRIEGLVALVAGSSAPIGQAVMQTWTANGGIAAEVDAGDALPGDAVADVVARFGRLDVPINAGAAAVPGFPLEAADGEAWDRFFHDHVHGALALARACLPHLQASPCPAIVNVTSLAGDCGAAGSGAWGPAQGALITLTRQMALEWAQDGIRVNAVSPGLMAPSAAASSGASRAALARRIPLGRPGRPGEIANLIVFLASPAASFVTAQVWNCDGGVSQSLYAAPMTRPSEGPG